MGDGGKELDTTGSQGAGKGNLTPGQSHRSRGAMSSSSPSDYREVTWLDLSTQDPYYETPKV